MTKTPKVLIIDDDDINNFLCTKVIEHTKFSTDVTSFQSANKSLTFIREQLEQNQDQLPDIIFLDINMPMMNGWDFLDEYRKILPDISKKVKIFMLSSSVYDEDVDSAKRHDLVTDYVIKPLTTEELDRIKDKI